MRETKRERQITWQVGCGMHVKAVVCVCTPRDGAGLYIDSGWESSAEEQRCRFEATHDAVTEVKNEVKQTWGHKVFFVHFGKNITY